MARAELWSGLGTTAEIDGKNAVHGSEKTDGEEKLGARAWEQKWWRDLVSTAVLGHKDGGSSESRGSRAHDWVSWSDGGDWMSCSKCTATAIELKHGCSQESRAWVSKVIGRWSYEQQSCRFAQGGRSDGRNQAELGWNFFFGKELGWNWSWARIATISHENPHFSTEDHDLPRKPTFSI